MACPSLATTHALTLMKELNYQREGGQFCDCVIHLQLNPGKHYLAHRSILAASSPVLSSLIRSQGALLDLQFPNITYESLGFLLEFIYTGKLPPPSWDDSLHSAATYLEMEELQQALSCRQMAQPGLARDMQTDGALPNANREVFEHQQTKSTLQSPSLNQERKGTSALLPSCEVVPVIHRASTAGCLEKPPVLSHNHRNSTEVDFVCHNIRIDDAKGMEAFGRHQYGRHQKHQGLLKNKAVLCGLRSGQSVGLHNYGKSVITNCGDADVKHKVDSFRDRSERDFIHPDGSICSTAHINAESLCGFRIEHLPPISQARISRGCPTTVEMEKTCTKTENAKLPDNANVDSSGEGNSVAFEGHATGVHNGALNTWKPEASGDICIHVNETSCPSKDNIWSETSNFCTGYPAVTGVGKMGGTSTERIFALQRNDNLMTPNTDNSRQEGWEFISQRESDSPAYHGQLMYHCFQKEGCLLKTTVHDGEVCSMSAAKADLRADSSVSMKCGLSPPPLQANISVEPSVRHAERQGRLSDSCEWNPGGPGAAQAYQCSMCEHAFSQRGSLNRHMRSHLGVRPYSCPHCPRTFSRQYRVTEHLRVHQRS